MKRLNLFRSTSDLKTAINLEVLEYPSIINVEDSTSLIETDLKYLSFYALEDAVFSFYPASFGLMYYSLDNGKTWNSGYTVSVKQGLVVSWKGNFLANTDFRIGQFESSGRFDVMGNIESIIDIDKYNNLQNRILSKEDYYEQMYLMYLQLLEVHETELLASINCTLENTYEELVRAICIALGFPEEELAKLDTEMYELFVTEYNPQRLTYPEIEELVYLSLLQMLLDAPKEEIELIFPNGFEHLSSKDLITTFFTLSGVDISNWTDNMYRSYIVAIYFESDVSLTSLGFRQLFEYAPIVNASNLILSDNTINYSKMFYNCGLLTTPPELPATTLVESCYSSMFSGCKSLKIAPLLPAMLLAPNCYRYMFLGCVNLVTPPLLPATTLENSCYYLMFSGCASLEIAPELPAKTLVYDCYYEMFYECKALNLVKMLATNSLSSSALTRWLKGTSEYGTVVIHPNSINIFLPNANWKLKPYVEPVICKNLLITADDVVGNATSTIVHYTAVCSILNDAGEIIREEIHNGIAESSKFDLNLSTTSSILRTVSYTYGGITATTDITQLPYLNVLKFTAVDGNVTLTFSNTTPIFYKSVDNEIWESWNGSAITLESNNSIYIKGENTTISKNGITRYFQSSGEGKLKCEGNVMGLLGDNITEITSEFCFTGLFYRCPNLITSPELPATTLTTSCYLSMFQKCQDLIIAPELPATTLATRCYSYMFSECTSLRNAPKLPATTLADDCYNWMFSYCSSLTIAPELPATVLAHSCYLCMFYECFSLEVAPELPATVLTQACYDTMFCRCISLRNAPELPATVLAPSCYYSMFYGCYNITIAPELPATTLTSNCYYLMFYGCTSLRNAPELPATELAYACYKYMFQNCIGILKMPELPATTLANLCYKGMFFNSGIYYTTTLPATELAELCYSGMLAQTSIKKAPELPATVLALECYDSMFLGCTYLEEAPTTLPATELADYCYAGMFKQTKIKSAPELPATILARYCYANMFAETNLTKAPKLPATTLAEYCYSGMFSDCIYLTEMPELPATTLANCCYYEMFKNCSSLVKSVKLPATTLSPWCYYGMFMNCTSLVNAPELPATEGWSSCYDNMFHGCTSLVNAPSKLFNNSANQCCRSMFYNCISLKNAPKLPATSLAEKCYLYMFSGCTSLEVAPELPATTLATYCYANMFENCTSLTKAPKLPATQLQLLCYELMFDGCKSLNYVVMLATTIALQSLYYWLNGTSEKGTVVKHPNTTLETGNSGVPTYWTVENYVES